MNLLVGTIKGISFRGGEAPTQSEGMQILKQRLSGNGRYFRPGDTVDNVFNILQKRRPDNVQVGQESIQFTDIVSELQFVDLPMSPIDNGVEMTGYISSGFFLRTMLGANIINENFGIDWRENAWDPDGRGNFDLFPKEFWDDNNGEITLSFLSALSPEKKAAPMIYVSYNEAAEFVRRLNLVRGGTGYEFGLPTLEEFSAAIKKNVVQPFHEKRNTCLIWITNPKKTPIMDEYKSYTEPGSPPKDIYKYSPNIYDYMPATHKKERANLRTKYFMENYHEEWQNDLAVAIPTCFTAHSRSSSSLYEHIWDIKNYTPIALRIVRRPTS